MELHVKVRKVGNSFIVTIPDLIVKETKIKLGDILFVDLIDDKIIMRMNFLKKIQNIDERRL